MRRHIILDEAKEETAKIFSGVDKLSLAHGSSQYDSWTTPFGAAQFILPLNKYRK
jgi:hypothetical protein